jgi:hypothetical protein
MINDEWPRIKADLDGGRLCPIALIEVKTTDPTMMGNNHQVLSYGYDLDGTSLTIHIYDPNFPRDDNRTISLDIGDPQHTTPVSDGIFCFFRQNYTFASPTAPAWPAAFQANTGNLWTVDHSDWELGMMAGTSPSIVALPGGTYEVAFQANTGNLWTVGADNHGDWELGMMAGTSPSIVALPGGTYEVAFQANTGNLWTVGADNHGDWGLGMKTGTSPSICA